MDINHRTPGQLRADAYAELDQFRFHMTAAIHSLDALNEDLVADDGSWAGRFMHSLDVPDYNECYRITCALTELLDTVDILPNV